MIQADSVVSTLPVFPTGSLLEVGWVLVVGGIAGALGAFGGDLAADAGKLDRTSKDTKTFGLGFVGKLIVGSVAAIAVLGLNPPGDSWLALIGTALVAGAGGEAIVMGFTATGRADAAAHRTKDAATVGIRQWESLEQSTENAGSLDTASILAQASAAKAALRTYL